MNKTTKGTIAASAAVLLLLGTGGSLAYWNSSADLGGQTISAGQLKVEQDAAAPVWKITHTTGQPTTVTDIAAVKLVPGDTLEYTGKFNITAQGQNLAFSVNLAKGSIAAATTGNAAANAALVTRLANSATFTVNGGAATNAGTVVTINEPTADLNGVKTHAVTVTAKIAWPFGDSDSPASDNPAQLGAVSLKDFALNIQQVDASL
ncbi:alternate-type signal peptide domain-containing protein [Microbacterium sp. OR21]|uniref:alternate-type signal peptide domain-containing protein n=1 Tax=Microbacterium sp. OR21 TaxID=3095346 RepID=UPI0039B47B6D